MTATLPLARKHRKPASAARKIEVSESLRAAVAEVDRVIPPLWPLRDYVAVNPYVGLADLPFLAAGRRLQSVRDCQFLLPKQYYRQCLASGRLNAADVSLGLEAARSESPGMFEGMETRDVLLWVQQPDDATEGVPPRFRTIARQVDEQRGSQWSAHILNDITRHCAAHFDDGQSSWSNPWKEKSLYQAWREASCISRRMDFLGLRGFRSLVKSLSDDPQTALQSLLQQLEIPERHWTPFLLCQAYSVAGWASYLRNLDHHADLNSPGNGDLLGLLAIRLAYDAAAKTAFQPTLNLKQWPEDWRSVAWTPSDISTLSRYVLQLALERSYQNQTLRALSDQAAVVATAVRKSVQLVFCIDVRSEVMRRQLESIDGSIETFGFAGFFGAAIRLKLPGSHIGTAQCPVLIKPAYNVIAEDRSACSPGSTNVVAGLRQSTNGGLLSRALKGSVIGGFSFVEVFGLANFGHLLRRTFTARRRPIPAAQTATKLCLEQPTEQSDDGRQNSQAALAESILRNLGLVSNFARTVVLCGHAADVVNNPYQAALACGACGGHSGEPNARFVASLLNEPAIRTRLAGRGITIPDDCWFLPAVHETTADTVSFRDTDAVPASHHNDLKQLRCWLDQASSLCRQERSTRFTGSTPKELLQRGSDWSQVRPEWGLAGNAALIVAPRSKTQGVNLGGRTFLHSYEHSRDPERKTLELILTAPMVVANWINLQYYASAVDPVAYGSGDKTIHNVVGKIGILQGNGGDLMTGLPWQSVHDGQQLRHEPLRLLAVVDAPRTDLENILQRHPHVRSLVTNGWISLVAWENDGFHRWTTNGSWAACEQPGNADARENLQQ